VQMRREEIKKEIQELLSEKSFGVKMPRDFSTHDSLFLRGVVDSFGIFPFVHELQSHFQVVISKGEIHPGNLETIENAATFIYNKKRKKFEA
jgi:acyl carrier protein